MKLKTKVLGAACTVLVLFGCGGGGGGLSATPVLVYRTDWSKSNQPNGGSSQRVTLFKSDGSVVSSVRINRTDLGQQDVKFENLGAGTYHLLAELFSQPDLAGLAAGQLDAQVQVAGPVTFSSSVGGTIDGVTISPSAATLSVPQSTRLFAIATSSSVATFSKASDFGWSAFGGVATVNSTGLVQAVKDGKGSIRATHLASGKSDSAAITVTGGAPTRSKWTVLVYMNAANDLFSFSTLNMNQMESVAQNPDVRFVVQWKQSQSLFPNSSFDGTRRYKVEADTTSTITSSLIQDLGNGIDMGVPATLSDFIKWGTQFYPADRYVLVVWNHGNGWHRAVDDLPSRAFSYDDETGNAIQLWQLPAALGTTHFDIAAWDASLMQMQEVAYEIRNNADFVVGSEESPPGEGYPYDLVFKEFRDNPDGDAKTLSKAFVDGMLAVPAYTSRKITQSVLDTSALGAVATSLNALSVQLINNRAALSTIIPSVRNQSQSYSQTPTRYYRDIIDLCQRLEAANSIASVDAASAAVRAAVANAVVWEGHNSNSAFSHGLAIDMSPSDVFKAYATDYGKLQFAQDTGWDQWLFVAP